MFLAILSTFLLFLAEGGGQASSGFMKTWKDSFAPYLNYPGFESWKFINLAIFLGILYYLLKKPLTKAFKAKREEIRADLIRAQEEREGAMKSLEKAEAQFAGLESEKSAIKDKAKKDAKAEKVRIANQTESEIAKLQTQATNEANALAQTAKRELRKYSAEEAISLAEKMIKEKIGKKESAQLIQTGIEGLGGAK